MVVGATGLFGDLLARRLVREQHFRVVAAGRTHVTLDAFTQETGADSAVIDRDDAASVNKALELHKPFAVVDCAGPFQYYGSNPYRFARQVIEAGCHYIDIADASDFVLDIRELDAVANKYRVAAISGASSTPAITAAVVDHLITSFTEVLAIETAIIPGNRTRRTLSVMQAIIGQVGQPFKAMVNGKYQTVRGWTDTRCIDLKIPTKNPVVNRLASLVDTPDGVLFPERYQAQTVTLRAGLEIRLFHRCLQMFGWLVRLRLMRSLLVLTPVARFIASRFVRLGSDAGGMQVVVTGQQTDGRWCRKTWELAASDGRGPEIPTLPVSVLLTKLRNAEVQAGARAAPGEITFDELSRRFNSIDAQTGAFTEDLQPIFSSVLGTDMQSLPSVVQAFHNQLGAVSYHGRAQSKGPTGVTGRIAAMLFGFPGVSDDIPVKVCVLADTQSEKWQREFSGSTFHSVLSRDKNGRMQERFGPITMTLGLKVLNGELHYPVASGTLFGFIPLPRWLLPKSEAHESVDEQGRFVFDVELRTPFGARIAHYSGWLVRST